MGDVTLTVQEMSRSGLAPTWTASGASPLLNVTDNFKFNNTGKEYLHFKKSGAGDCTVTLKTPGTVDGLAVADRTVTVPATTGEKIIGPFPVAIYNDTQNTFNGFTVSEVTGLTCCIIRMP
jgi:hypothetical protein